jgi:hypothetical protein
VVVGLDTGFQPFPKTDPVVLADITGNGGLSSQDATLILREVVLIDVPEIPPLPGLVVPPVDADPLVHMPVQGAAAPGGTAIVPVMIDEAHLLESVELTIAYDTSKLDVVAGGVRKGSLTQNATLLTNVESAAGMIRIAMVLPRPLGPGSGSLVEIEYRVKETALPGPALLDMRHITLNEGSLVLTVVPQVGEDATDGRITIEERGARAVEAGGSGKRDEGRRLHRVSSLQVPGPSLPFGEEASRKRVSLFEPAGDFDLFSSEQRRIRSLSWLRLIRRSR